MEVRHGGDKGCRKAKVSSGVKFMVAGIQGSVDGDRRTGKEIQGTRNKFGCCGDLAAGSEKVEVGRM